MINLGIYCIDMTPRNMLITTDSNGIKIVITDFGYTWCKDKDTDSCTNFTEQEIPESLNSSYIFHGLWINKMSFCNRSFYFW